MYRLSWASLIRPPPPGSSEGLVSLPPVLARPASTGGVACMHLLAPQRGLQRVLAGSVVGSVLGTNSVSWAMAGVAMAMGVSCVARKELWGRRWRSIRLGLAFVIGLTLEVWPTLVVADGSVAGDHYQSRAGPVIKCG